MQTAELRDVGEPGAAHHRLYARHTAEEILLGAPDGTARDCVIEVAIGGRDPSREPADVIHQAAPNRAHRVRQPMPLGGQPVEPLAAARHQRVQLLDGCVGERAWRGAHPLSKERQDVRGIDERDPFARALNREFLWATVRHEVEFARLRQRVGLDARTGPPAGNSP